MDSPAIEEKRNPESAQNGDAESILSAADQAEKERAQWLELLKEKRLALAKDPRNVDLLTEVGELAEVAGDTDRALWAFKRAIRMEPENAAAHRNLGHLYESQGKTKQAAAAMQNYYRYSGGEAGIGEASPDTVGVTGEEFDELSLDIAQSPVFKKLARKMEELGVTPAEAIYLLDPENSSGQKMMRFTLLDLITRGVLALDAKYGVGKGEKFDLSDLEPHETLFARYFSRYEDLVDIDKLAQSVAIQLNRRFDLYRDDYVRRALIDKGYFQKESYRAKGIIPLQRYSLTGSGRRARNTLRRLMKKADTQVARALKTDPQQARALLENGGPSLLLVDSNPSGSFRDWIETMERMGFGPAVERAKSSLQRSPALGVAEEIIRAIFEE